MGRHENDSWAADTAISRPEPPRVPVMVDFGGFGFTMNGMAHNLSEGDVEDLIIPTFAPEGYRGFDEVIDFEDDARAEEQMKYQEGKVDGGF